MVIILGLLGFVGFRSIHAEEPDPRTAGLADEVRSSGWIVYSARSKSGDWDLFLMRPDGSSTRNITNTPTFHEAAPRFSPDGKRLLYRRLERVDEIDHDRYGFAGELVIADSNGENAVTVGKAGELPWASWSPDGQQLACLSLEGIEIFDLASATVVRRIPRKGIYQQLCWSPDGRWFCGVSNHFGESWTVVRMDVETGEVNAVNSFQNCTPDWLPDSQRLLFSFRPGNQDGYGWTQLWAADGDGGSRALLYGHDGYHVYGGVTSPDGKYVVFTSSIRDGGGAERAGAPMHLMRLLDSPMIQGESPALRKLLPETTDGPVLSLPEGWEPHWTYSETEGQATE